MKVLRLISGLDPRSGGPPVSAVSSAIAAARCGVETHFAFAAADPGAAGRYPGVRRLAAEGIPFTVHPLPRLFTRQAARVGYSPALRRFVAREIGRFDVVHVHGPWTYPALTAVGIAGRAGRPVVLTPHEALTAYDMSHARVPGFRFAKRLLRRHYLRHLAAVVFSSALERADSAVAPMPPEWIVVPHPVYDERADGIQTPPIPLRAEFRGGLVGGLLGRLHKKKISSSPSPRCAALTIASRWRSPVRATTSSRHRCNGRLPNSACRTACAGWDLSREAKRMLSSSASIC